MLLWQSSIKERLKDALCRAARATHDSEAALALEFYMAGVSRRKLAPSIIITCCSAKKKREVKMLLSGLKWVKDSGFRCIVTIDETFGSRAEDSATSGSSMTLEAKVSSISQTLCGAQAQFICGLESSAVRCTLGGIIRVNDRLYCLTSGHPFIPIVPEPQTGENLEGSVDATELNGYESDTTEESTSDSGSGEKSNEIELERIGVSDIDLPKYTAQRNIWDATIPLRPIGNGLSFSCESPPEQMEKNASATNRRQNSDWALLLATETIWPLNTIQIPGGDPDRVYITGINCNKDLGEGHVWIAAGSGMQSGTLSASASSIFLHGTFHEVRQITLGHNLGKIQFSVICFDCD
jgi:hypothetical protein